MDQGWFLIEESSGKFYTDAVSCKRLWFYHGDGMNRPTPKELKELVESVEDGQIEDSTGLVYNYHGKEYSKPPVELPAGCYTHHQANPSGVVPERLVPTALRTDSYIKMESIYNPVVDDIKAFLSAEPIYRQIGSIYKRGVLLYGPPGEGKCLGKGTPVLMYDGRTVPVEDIQVGDRLMGDDNSPRTVLSLARGRERLYRISYLNGSSFVCNESHILSLKWSGGGRGKIGEVRDISVRDFLASSADDRHHLKGYTTGADFQPGEALPLPPYLLGHWLGDGSTAQPEFTTMDLPIVREYQKYADANGLILRLQGTSGRAGTYILRNSGGSGQTVWSSKRDSNAFTSALRQLGVFENKHIPVLCIRQSRHDRMELLAGLMDSDGSANRTAYDYCSVIPELAQGTAALARSLGFRATVRSRMTKDQNGVPCLSYRVRISGGGLHEVPVRLESKRLPVRRQKKNQQVFGITVTPLDEGDYYGFEIDGNGRFLLGDFVVTHNTSMLRCIVANELPKDAVVIFFETMPSNGFIKKMKETLGSRLKLFVFEELANVVEGSRLERVLDFLDGEKSIDKTLMIATTNYPERLPGNIVERPSRFDKLYKMGHPKASERKLLLNHYLLRPATEEEVTATDGLSTAAIKECSFLVHMKKISLAEAAKLLKTHSELVKKEFSESRPIGLGRGDSYYGE